MAVPKKKTSPRRRDHRRHSAVYLLPPVETTSCPECGEWVRPHRLCSKLHRPEGKVSRPASKASQAKAEA